MTALLKHAWAAAAMLALPLLAPPASATPFVGVRATWDAAPSAWEPLPEGLTLSCRGDAQGGASGCGNTLSLAETVTASATYGVTSTGSVVLVNTSDHAINGFAVLSVWFSAFNPGGPAVGLRIDDPAAQWASFSSSVGGGGNGSVGDNHSCAVGYRGESGTVFSPTSCGVGSPDSSQAPVYAELIDFLPGAEAVFTFAMNITATFDLGEATPAGVPEPASALMALGLGALLARRRSGPLGQGRPERAKLYFRTKLGMLRAMRKTPKTTTTTKTTATGGASRACA